MADRDYTIQAPDGRELTIVGPDNATPDQLRSAAEAAFSKMPKAGPVGTPLSRTDKVLTGVADPIHGGAQLLTNVLPDRVVKAGNDFNNWLADKTGLVARLPEGGVDQQVKEREAQYQADRAAGGESGFDGYRALGNAISPANYAVAARVPAAATTLGKVGVGALSGGASALLNPVTEGDFLTEKAKQAGIGAAFGGAAPAVMAGVSRVISPKASVNPDLKVLQDAGVRPTIGQTLGGFANAAEEKLTSVPFLGDAISASRKRAIKDFNSAAINRATEPVGVNVKGVGQEAVAEAGDAVSKAYDDVLSGLKTVKFDTQFATDVGQLKSMAQNLTPEMRKKFNNTLSNNVGMRTSKAGGMQAETFKKAESDIGKLAASYRSSSTASERELGDALGQLQSLMRDQVARTSPAASKALKAADEGWANLVRVEGAAKAAANSDGVFTPGQLNQAIRTADKSVRKRAVARGEALMQDLGSAGQNVLGNKVPDSGTAGRALLGGGGLGALAYFEPTTALLTGAVGGGGALLYTPLGQAILRGTVSKRPELAGPMAEALRKASPALAPAGAQIGLELGKQHR